MTSCLTYLNYLMTIWDFKWRKAKWLINYLAPRMVGGYVTNGRLYAGKCSLSRHVCVCVFVCARACVCEYCVCVCVCVCLYTACLCMGGYLCLTRDNAVIPRTCICLWMCTAHIQTQYKHIHTNTCRTYRVHIHG